MAEDKHTSNILNGLLLFTKISSKTKIISHTGAIDVILPTSIYSIEELISLKTLEWEQLSDYSWRYYLENSWRRLNGKFEPDPQFDEVLEHIEQFRKDIDEEVGRYYDEEYKIVEELQYND